MNLQTKVYLAAGVAALVIAIVGGGAMWSNHKIAQAEREVEAVRAVADEKEKQAAEIEIEAAAYKAKNEYLEAKIADIGAIARRQDDELEKLKTNTGDAGSRVERARSIRSIDTTADELCARLADIGHGCQ